MRLSKQLVSLPRQRTLPRWQKAAQKSTTSRIACWLPAADHRPPRRCTSPLPVVPTEDLEEDDPVLTDMHKSTHKFIEREREITLPTSSHDNKLI